MVVKRSLRDRYQMHDPSVGSYLLVVSPSYQFLAEFTTPNPGYVYKAISYQINPSISQQMEERRIRIIRNFYPHNSSLPLNIINNIVIRVCISKSVNQLCYALHLKEEDNLIIPILLFSFQTRKSSYQNKSAILSNSSAQASKDFPKQKLFCRRIHVHHQIQLWQFCQRKSASSGGIFSFIYNLITSVENGTPRTSYYLLFKKSQGILSLCTPFEDAFQEKTRSYPFARLLRSLQDEAERPLIMSSYYCVTM